MKLARKKKATGRMYFTRRPSMYAALNSPGRSTTAFSVFQSLLSAKVNALTSAPR